MGRPGGQILRYEVLVDDNQWGSMATVTDERVAWLHAQIDDEERTAQACPGDRKWTASDIAIYGPHLSPEVRAHMARHDPARVLRKVEAMRGVLAMYETQRRMRDENAQTLAKMGRSGQWSHPKWGEEFGRLRALGWELDGRVNALRMVVQQLAVEYANRPGYQELWGQQ